MAVKKGGLRGLLNQNASDVLDSMQANSNNAAAEPVANGGGVGPHSEEALAPAPSPGPTPAPVKVVPVEEDKAPAPSGSSRQQAPTQRPTNRPTNRVVAPAPVEEPPAEEVEEDEPRRAFFEELDRKEVRVYTDQMIAITSLRQAITRGKKRKGERITENTLIRTAIDLLLERQDEIQGITENEIRVSLGLDPR